jgi:hypothetical protein
VKKWTHELNKEFSKEEFQMASKYMKKCSTSLVIKEMHIKITLRFRLVTCWCPSVAGWRRGSLPSQAREMAHEAAE